MAESWDWLRTRSHARAPHARAHTLTNTHTLTQEATECVKDLKSPEHHWTIITLAIDLAFGKKEKEVKIQRRAHERVPGRAHAHLCYPVSH